MKLNPCKRCKSKDVEMWGISVVIDGKDRRVYHVICKCDIKSGNIYGYKWLDSKEQAAAAWNKE